MPVAPARLPGSPKWTSIARTSRHTKADILSAAKLRMETAAYSVAPDSPAALLVEGMVDLVPLPQAYVRVRALVDDPLADLREVAAIVGSDPALTGRVLRLVNSAYIGLMAPVDSIDHAVRVLGMEKIHDMALATSAVGSLAKLRGDLFDLFDFWRLSIYCAGTARELAERVGLPSPQRLFVSGLLHNIGSLIIAHEMPEAFEQSRQRARKLGRPYFELQREMFGFDYAEVGAEIMRRWNLPEALISPVLQHTCCIGNIAEADQPAAAILSIGATTARAASWQSDDSEPIPDYDVDALALTSLEADDIEALMAHVDDAVAESLAALIPDY
jgi:HD-like signal output (HDOD) protein